MLATNTSDADWHYPRHGRWCLLNIAVAETVPRIDSHITGKVDSFLMLSFFTVCCIPNRAHPFEARSLLDKMLFK